MATLGKSDVHYYDSGMSGAPNISTAPHTLSGVIKACLVDGFGGEAAQGRWGYESLGGEYHKFISTDPHALGHYLVINDQVNYARPTLYALDGERVMHNDMLQYAYPKYNSSNWALYADSRCFYIFSTNGANSIYSSALAFGDGVSFIDGDSYHCFIMAHQSGIDYNHFIAELERRVDSHHFVGGHNQSKSPIQFAKHTEFVSSAMPMSLGRYSAGVRPDAPAFLSDEIQVSPILLYEGITNSSESATILRCRLPGLYNPTINNPAVGVYTNVREFPGSSFKVQIISIAPSNYAYGIFDITGPWRDDGTLSIEGTVTEMMIPGAYRVNLFRQSDMKLLKTTWSEENGAYSFTKLANQKYVVVAIDHTDPLRSAAIQSDVVPS